MEPPWQDGSPNTFPQTVLELHELTLRLGDDPDAAPLLSEITASFPNKGHFAAILGPSGCGKSTLLKVIAGLREPTSGRVGWEGRDLAEEGDLDPHEIGYVPQFSIAYEGLTVAESVECALRLRVAGLSADEHTARGAEIIRDVGLDEIADRRVSVLSGGQKRRLALALEMVSGPRLLLCDEVTSGLDPKAEDEIAHLLHGLSRRGDRLVLSVTHSLRHLTLCDSVLLLFGGGVAYHGSAEFLFHYFGVERHEDLFPQLARRTPAQWHESWRKHRVAYYGQSGLLPAAAIPAESVELPTGIEHSAARQVRVDRLVHDLEQEPEEKPRVIATGTDKAAPAKPLAATPSALTQFTVLLARRVRLFSRDRSQVALQLALLLGFPCLVVIFALDGLPQLKSLAVPSAGNVLQQMQSEFSQITERIRAGSLVSGLIMFQLILLALMGSNNAAREIAGERLIFEKEKFAGLRPGAYLASKAVFLGALVLAQSVWMAVFVNAIVRFPGNLGDQILLLTLVNAALTAVCLAVSSLARTAEQASLVSIYLVGFQLPLSGAVLAMPAAIERLAQPFIATYWGWSGFIQTLRDTRLYEAIQQVTHTHLSATPLCLAVLAAHLLLGLYLAYTGCRTARWD